MYRNFNDEPKTLDFKLWAEQFEFHTRMYFRKQEGSSPFTIEIIARRQDGYAIKNSFNYSEILDHIPITNRRSLLNSPMKLLEEIKERVKAVVDGDEFLLVLQETTFGREVDLIHCIEKQRTKDWKIKDGTDEYRMEPMLGDKAPDSPTLRRKRAKEGQMPWHTGNIPAEIDTNTKKKFTTTLRTSDRESFSAHSVDLSTIRDSTLQSLLAPPLPPSAVHSPPADIDLCYEADSEDSEDEEPMSADRLTALATSRWEDDINFGDSPIDSPADDAPILPVVEQKHDEGSEFWGEFTDTKSLAQKAKERAERKKAARAARAAGKDADEDEFRGMGSKASSDTALERESLSTGGGCALELNLNDGNIHLDDFQKSEENHEYTDPELSDEPENIETTKRPGGIYNLSDITERLPVNPNKYSGQPELTDQELKYFHRPRSDLMVKGGLLPKEFFTPVIYSNSVETVEEEDDFSLGGSGVRRMLRKRSDFSARDGQLVMLEYGLEERPRVLTNVGSPSVLLNFVRHNDNGSHPRLVANANDRNRQSYDFTLGRTIELGNKALPLIGNINKGASQCVSVNSLTKTPAFEQKSQHTDFLVVIGTDTISDTVTAKVREMPDLMVMGQQEFIATVEKPHSKRINHFVQKYMKYHVRNLFRQCPQRPAALKTNQVQQMLWRQPYLQIRTILNQLSKYKRKGDHGRMWVLKEDADEQADENIASKEICLYEASLASQMHLRTLGLPKLAEAPHLQKVLRERRLAAEGVKKLKELSEKKDDPDLEKQKRCLKAREKLLKVIETQLKLTAWEWTRQYMDYHVQVLGATLLEINDPSLQPCSKAIGFAFALPANHKADRPMAKPKDKVAGNPERDLRTITVSQLSRMCRELGYTGPRMARWDMVSYVRKHSTDERLNRPFRETNNLRRSRYKKTCQRRFDAQRKAFSKQDLDTSSSSSSSDMDIFNAEEWEDEVTDDDESKVGKTDILSLVQKSGRQSAASSTPSSPAAVAPAAAVSKVKKTNVDMASQFPADIFAIASGGNTKKPAPLDLFGMSVEGSRLPSEDSSRVNSTNVSTFATPNPSRPGSPSKSGKSSKAKMFRHKGCFWVIKVTRVDRNNKTVLEYIRAKKEVGQEMKRIYAQRRGKERSIQRRFKQQTKIHTKAIMKRKTVAEQQRELEELQKLSVHQKNFIEKLSTGTQVMTPRTPGSKKIRCSACHQEGHMRTNKMCPFYRHANVTFSGAGQKGMIVIDKGKLKPDEKVTIDLSKIKTKVKQAMVFKEKRTRDKIQEDAASLWKKHSNKKPRTDRVRNPEIELRKMLVRALHNCSLEPLAQRFFVSPPQPRTRMETRMPNCWSEFLRDPVQPKHFINSSGYDEYMAKIKHPISYSEIRKHIESDKTPTRNKLMKDLNLLAHNAVKFHGAPSLNPNGISAIATNLKEAVWTTLYVKDKKLYDELEESIPSLWEKVDDEVLLEGLFFTLPICSKRGVESSVSVAL